VQNDCTEDVFSRPY